ncbi:MAG: winged helix-turn-helix transcriptional regulator [Acidobacteria bacterium]|nr:winged helix-turn-helix transcriptional regulator [Acidobacteriota bacterium]
MPTKEAPSLYLQSPRLNQLNILREIAANPTITQAELARLCLLSVAMVNNYMKELCCSGLIEYRRKTTKSVTYHLTSSGADHLKRLQSDLIDEMVNMFVTAKEQIRARIMSQAPSGFQRVLLYGSGHLAQIVFHALEVAGVKILGICDYDIEKIGSDFCGRVVLSPSQIRFLDPDAVIIADPARTSAVCRKLELDCGQRIGIIRLDGLPIDESFSTASGVEFGDLAMKPDQPAICSSSSNRS